MMKSLFEKEANAENKIGMEHYMRDRYTFYGIKTPQRREIYREFLKNERKSKVIDWNFINQCFNDEHREFQYLACDYIVRMQQFLVFDDLERLQNYIQTKSWWDTVDALTKVVGKLTLRSNEGKSKMIQWSLDDDFWIRRVAIDHQLGFKNQTDQQLLAVIIQNNFDSNEFFINKAIGWSLREYSKTDPIWVAKFVEKHHSHMNSLSIREASKYLKGKK